LIGDKDESLSQGILDFLSNRGYSYDIELTKMIRSGIVNNPYGVFRSCQGDIDKILLSGCLLDASNPRCFEDFIYILNFDENQIELYYEKYPVNLKEIFPFDSIPENWLDLLNNEEEGN